MRKPLQPVDWCPICEAVIYAHNEYTWFADGYAHVDCIMFLRKQAELSRKNSV